MNFNTINQKQKVTEEQVVEMELSEEEEGEEENGKEQDQEKLKINVKKLRDDQEKLKLNTISIQVKQSEGKIIIKNLPLNTKLENNRENNKQSREVMKRFLHHANLTLSDTLEIYRIQNDDENTRKNPPMIVKFRSRYEFFTLMRNVDKIKRMKCYQNVQIHQFIPPLLIDDFKKASKVAYFMRINKQKTRIDVIDNKIVLRAKSQKEKTYKEIDYHDDYL